MELRQWQPDSNWRTLSPDSEKTCRDLTRIDRKPVVCRAPAKAEFLRFYRNGKNQWWAYCEDHLFGREIRDGVVMAFHLVSAPAAPETGN